MEPNVSKNGFVALGKPCNMSPRNKRKKRKGYRAANLPLQQLLGRYSIKREIKEHRLLSHWKSIVGERIANNTFPDGFEKGTLWVRVKSSAWMHELSFMKSGMITKANEILGEKKVTDIRLHLGGRRSRSDDPLAPTIEIRRQLAKARTLPEPPKGDALESIKSEVDTIADEGLRAAVLEARKKLAL